MTNNNSAFHNAKAVKKVVIAGGGTAGWMAAALLKKVLGSQIDVDLIESNDIGIVGVGEATIPPIQIFNQYLGIDEKEFLRETNGTIKLAIQFENWRVKGESYLHTFGAPGTNIGFCSFQHYWLRAKQEGLTQSLWDYDLNYLACKAGKVGKINNSNPIHEMQYAYHFDSALYGKYLRKLSESSGVIRHEGIIDKVDIDDSNGFIKKLKLNNNKEISGDLFIDCTGFKGLLIKQHMQVEYEDWSHYLPANTALAVPTKRFDTTLLYTRSIAHHVGWQWRIPLTHRNGNGIVFSDQYMSENEAHETLMSNLDSPVIGDVKKIRFCTGRTVKQWHKNVVSLGLSSGFLEPLESTSIHLIQSALVRLLKMFPNEGISQSTVDGFNAESKLEFETIRDFIILHYHLTERTDSDFWNDMRLMKIPQRLAHKMEIFADTAAIFNDNNDIFRDASWLQVMLGQGSYPRDFHPAAKVPNHEDLLRTFEQIRSAKQQPLAQLLSHDEFLKTLN
jgi:tryptophan halogenase